MLLELQDLDIKGRKLEIRHDIDFFLHNYAVFHMWHIYIYMYISGHCLNTNAKELYLP